MIFCAIVILRLKSRIKTYEIVRFQVADFDETLYDIPEELAHKLSLYKG